MITILTGENSFILQKELRRITDNFISEYGDMAVEQFDGEEAEFDRLREALQSLPFLANKKLIVIRSASANNQFCESAESLLNEKPESTDVLIVETKLDKRTGYYKLLKKQSGFHEYNEPDTHSLVKWLVQTAKDNNADITSNDANYLIERVGAKQRLLSNELDKLILYNKKITRETIELLTERTPQSTIFELLDASLAGKTQLALELYQEQRAMKVEPQQILALLGWQLHAMALMKTADERDTDTIAREAKLNPYVVRKSGGIVRGMSLKDLKELIHKTLELDIRLKSESIDADEALQNLILDLKK